MAINDKHGLLADIPTMSSPVLELGCGGRRRWPEAISVDLLDHPTVDIVGDVFEVLPEIGDGALGSVKTSHFLEHIEDLDGLMRELARVLSPGGTVEAVVPHFSNPYYYSDPTHRRFFGLYTFSYMCSEELFRRRVPQYGTPLPMRVTSVDLVFQSTRPFYARHALKRALGFVFNLSRFSKEFYEENLTWLFPCYSVRYVLTRDSS
jgi:SAM-dependent methyltransferase